MAKKNIDCKVYKYESGTHVYGYIETGKSRTFTINTGRWSEHKTYNQEYSSREHVRTSGLYRVLVERELVSWTA